jgi:hypothetical protein
VVAARRGPAVGGVVEAVSEIRVSLTAGNLRNNHVYLLEHLDFFPPDVLGVPNAHDGEGVPVKLRFDGTGEESVTDIPSDKLISRARAAWGRSFRRHASFQ